jgi:Domain of unknown function (DUF5658)
MVCRNVCASERSRDQQCLRAETTVWRRQRLARAHWILWTLFIGLQIADVVTTDYALAVPGNWEANPIMHLSQSHLGAVWWLPKVAAIAIAAAVVPRTSRPWPILFAVSYYIIIVSVNLACL